MVKGLEMDRGQIEAGCWNATGGSNHRHTGWARVYNVCNVRSVEDLQVLLSPQMRGLGVDSVEELCKECNIDSKLIDLGHLILFNLQFLSHNLAHVNGQVLS